MVAENGGSKGIALAEVYDLTSGATSQLANISTRGLVQPADNVLIGGIIVGPDTSAPAKILLRALGPSTGIPGALQDPTLALVDANGASLSNDDWRSTQEPELKATGVPPRDDREAAILATLNPGLYTAIVRGKGDATGAALVEAYNLP